MADGNRTAIRIDARIVVVEAEHSCMSLRGARATGATTLTTVLRGQLRDDPASRAEFLTLTRDRSPR